jgi:hypothetical protein
VAVGVDLLGVQEEIADGLHAAAALALLGVVQDGVDQVAGAIAQLAQGVQGGLAQQAPGHPKGVVEEVGDGLAGAVLAEQSSMRCRLRWPRMLARLRPGQRPLRHRQQDTPPERGGED